MTHDPHQDDLPFDELEPDPDELKRLDRDRERRVADLTLELGQYESDLAAELAMYQERRPYFLANLVFSTTTLRAWLDQLKRLGVLAPLPNVFLSAGMAANLGKFQPPSWILNITVVDGPGFFVAAYTMRAQ